MQLPLRIAFPDHATFENFESGSNCELVAYLYDYLLSPGGQAFYLWGPPGCGKTHLMQALCRTATDRGFAAAYLPFERLDELHPDCLERLEELHVVCVDDVDKIAGRRLWEEALFHLYNRMREIGHMLVVAGSRAPGQLGFAMPDLVTRLGWGLVYQVHELRDDEKVSVLRRRAKTKGLVLTEEVAEYLIRRCPRDMASLMLLLDALDRASLAQKRRLTIPFVKALIDERGGRPDE